MANKNFQLHSVEIPPTNPANDLKHLIHSDEELYVLVTEIKGEIPAESFLVFTPSNAKEIAKFMLPADVASQDEMIEAVLLEIDNILTASVVTQFSNFFNRKIFGDVPNLMKLNKEEAEHLIEMHMEKYDIRVSFRTSFIADNSNIFPEFVWLFDNTLIDEIKRVASENRVIEGIEKFKEKLSTYIIY